MRSLVHQAVDVDKPVVQGPGTYWGGLLVADSVGYATATIYDGDSTAGELIGSLIAPALETDRDRPPIGIHFERFLYVDISANVSKFTLFYEEDTDPPSDQMMQPGSNPAYPGQMGMS